MIEKEKVKLPADLLEIGMYVSELDRPWIETSFIFQGFLITNEDELDQLNQQCEYVYVDITKSQVNIPQHKLKTIKSDEPEEPVPTETIQRPYTTSFEEEFPEAKRIYEHAQTLVRSTFKDVRMGRHIRGSEIRPAVEKMANSIIRNPDAMLLMTNMKSLDDQMVAHAINVCILSLSLARYLGIENEGMYELGLGALLHDIGEIRLPAELLKQQRELSPEEYATMQKHTEYGVAVLEEGTDIPQSAIDVALHHHERNDRSGYPHRLAGTEITLFAKIVGMVDIYDSLTSAAPNKTYITSTDALKSMYDWRDHMFEKELVEKFIQCLGIYPIGSTVELYNGEIGIVISVSPENRLYPKLMLVRDNENDIIYDPPRIINLTHFRDVQDARYDIKTVVQPEQYGIDLKRYILRELYAQL